MAQVVVTPVNGGGAKTWTDGTSTFDWTVAGKYCEKYYPGTRKRDVRFAIAPGEQGAGTQDFRFDTQSFTVVVVYVQGSEDTVNLAIDQDMSAVGQVSTITIGASVTHGGCRLVDCDADRNNPKSTGIVGAGTFWQRVTYKFESGRPSDEDG